MLLNRDRCARYDDSTCSRNLHLKSARAAYRLSLVNENSGGHSNEFGFSKIPSKCGGRRARGRVFHDATDRKWIACVKNVGTGTAVPIE